MKRVVRLALGAIWALAMAAAHAADRPASPPPNASASPYGGAWQCDDGWREMDGSCEAVAIPPNAYATPARHGQRGWTCQRGFEQDRSGGCAEVVVPDNAHLSDYGDRWICDRGYRSTGQTCAVIVVPENAYLTDLPYGSGWTCDRGFRAEGASCRRIAVPENGFLSGDGRGAGWTCERGFRPDSGACKPIAVPANAYLTGGSHGSGWRCERGFRPVADTCEVVVPPPNAHLSSRGDAWNCDPPFQRRGQVCVQP